MNPNIEEGLPEGKYRLEVYECIKAVIGRDLAPAEHKHLSHVLKMYANTARVNSQNVVINKHEPVIHKWVCDNCGGETETSKRTPGSPKVKTMIYKGKKNAEALAKKNEKEGS